MGDSSERFLALFSHYVVKSATKNRRETKTEGGKRHCPFIYIIKNNPSNGLFLLNDGTLYM
jgi:hypothetical protein